MTSNKNKFRIVPALIAITLCGVYFTQNHFSASAQTPSTTAAGTTAADAQTRKIVAAANAFLATLSEAQKKTVLFEFTDASQRTRWSNFPSDFVKRSGVRWGELNDTQRAALMDLLGAILSPKGVKMIREQMHADDIVRDTPPAARANIYFGSDYFYASFVGQPSTTSPWMFQFGAHHLGLNATVVGPNVTLSPSLTGGEPLKFIMDGKPVYIVSEEATSAMTLLNALNAGQRKKAIISTQRINLVLGPGKDGKVLQAEGLAGKDMTDAQKTQLLDVIAARLGILNADDFAAAMAVARKNLNDTWFAWYGPTAEVGEAYFRVTGPTLSIEFAPQDDDVRFPAPSQHAHNMYRDPTNEYGAAWTSLK